MKISFSAYFLILVIAFLSCGCNRETKSGKTAVAEILPAADRVAILSGLSKSGEISPEGWQQVTASLMGSKSSALQGALIISAASAKKVIPSSLAAGMLMNAIAENHQTGSALIAPLCIQLRLPGPDSTLLQNLPAKESTEIDLHTLTHEEALAVAKLVASDAWQERLAGAISLANCAPYNQQEEMDLSTALERAQNEAGTTRERAFWATIIKRVRNRQPGEL